MQFQFDTSSANRTPPVVPQQTPAEATIDLLRQLVELQRDSAVQQREVLAQLLAVQQEHLNHTRAAAQDALGRWRNLLSRWQSQHPEFSNQCRQAYPLLEKAYVAMLAGLVDELSQQGDDALENEFAVQEFLDRYGMRVGQLSHLLSVIGPLAEAASQAETK
jgi:hypothetical protein